MGRYPSSHDGPATWLRHARYFQVDSSDFRALAVKDTIDEPVGFDCDGPAGSIYSFPPLFGRRGPLRAFISPARLASVRTDTDMVDIVDTSTGDTTTTFTPELPAVAVNDTSWADAIAEYREEEQEEGPFACDIDAMRPVVLPRIRAILTDDVGRLWTEVRVAAQSYAFVVTDATGAQDMFVAAPARDDGVAPYVRGNRLYSVHRDEYDVQSIRVHELTDLPAPDAGVAKPKRR